MAETMLKAKSSIPLYRQLGDILRTHIQAGEWAEDSQIPTELELSKQYNTSRITVRNAIEELVEDGLLIRKQGKGTFVAPQQQVKKNIKEFWSFTETCRNSNRVPGSRLLKTEAKLATTSQAEFLQLKDPKRIISIKRVRFADGQPVMLETNIFPVEYSFLLAEDLDSSIYEILREKKIFPKHSTKLLDVCVANEEESEYLEIEPGTPLLLVEDLVWNDGEKPLHICKQAIRTDLFRYIIEQSAL